MMGDIRKVTGGETVVAIGIIFIALGIVFFVCIMKGLVVKFVESVVCGIYFTVFGCLALIAKVYWSEAVQFRVAGTGVGLLFAGVAIASGVELLLCNTRIKAIYIRCNEYPGKNGVVRYAPVFQYRYGEKNYEVQTAQSFSKRYIKRHLKPNEVCGVYISSKRPQSVLYSKKPAGSMLFMFAMGVMFAVCSWMVT